MALSIAKLVDSELQDTKRSSMRQKVLNKFVAKFNKVLSYSKKQERRPSETNTVVSSVVVELPDDIVEEILHRLGLKNLVRWKSVSKGWKSLIESNHVAEKQLGFNKKKYGDNKAFKIRIESCSKSDISIKYFTKQQRLIGNNNEEYYLRKLFPLVPGSCNGLICVYDFIDVYILNPVTRVIRTLPHPPKTSLVGFGRDTVSGRYKVVVLYRRRFDDNDKIVKVKVFDLSSNEWRFVPVFLPSNTLNLLRPLTNPVFVNGSLFWLLDSEILVMDLHTEKFRHILLLPKISSVFGYLWSQEDRLCVGEYNRQSHLGVYNVWVLVEDNVWDKNIYVSSMETHVTPPLLLNYAWFSPSLLSPYQ